MTCTMVGTMLFGLGTEAYVWAFTAFLTMLFIPIVQGSSQAIWQAKVAPDLQGRVFAIRSLIAQISTPLSMLISGPLADHIFEPAMMPKGGLVSIFGGLIGSGPGAGMALMFFIAGILGVLVSLGGYALQVVRNVEDILPDYEVEHT